MAERPVFVPLQHAPFFRPVKITFEWHGGFAKVQSQKNIRAIHEGFNRICPGVPVLEISSKGWQEGSEELSAFHMTKSVPNLEKSVPIECIYQAGKVFQNSGAHPDWLKMTPKETKELANKLSAVEQIVGYEFEGKRFPLTPVSLFYNFIWINGLMEHSELAKIVLQYGAFTDIIFSSNSVNCQAAAAAAFVSLDRLGLLEYVKTAESFYKLMTDKEYVNNLVVVESKNVSEAFNLGAGAYKPIADTNTEKISVVSEAVPKPKAKKAIVTNNTAVETVWKNKVKILESAAPAIAVGDVVKHKKFGEGNVIEITDGSLKIIFPEAGEKLLGRAWVIANCEIEGK